VTLKQKYHREGRTVMKKFTVRVALLLLILAPFGTAGSSVIQAGTGAATNPPSLAGTWQGRFSSRNFASFPVTLIINQAVGVKLTGAVNLGSPCLRNANLQVTVSGLNVVLSGSGPKGDSITFKGTVDSAGTQLTMTYILNASASGKCETDDGAGTLDKS
jgi:hypothetical protein